MLDNPYRCIAQLRKKWLGARKEEQVCIQIGEDVDFWVAKQHVT